MAEPAEAVLTEGQRVVLQRFHEARRAGLTRTEARRFADGNTDVGLLRKCVAGGCAPALAAKILI